MHLHHLLGQRRLGLALHLREHALLRRGLHDVPAKRGLACLGEHLLLRLRRRVPVLRLRLAQHLRLLGLGLLRLLRVGGLSLGELLLVDWLGRLLLLLGDELLNGLLLGNLNGGHLLLLRECLRG